MDQNGVLKSLNLLVSLNEFDWAQRKQVQQTKEYQEQLTGQTMLLGEFKKIGSSGDMKLIVKSEQLVSEQELQLYGHEDKTILPTLSAAVKDFEVINNALKVVQSPEAYQAAASTYHSKRKVHGVVADGCHEAMNGHITRLGNRMSAVGVSVPEKNILRQRQGNMRKAKEIYIGLQRQALGLPALEKDVGLGR